MANYIKRAAYLQVDEYQPGMEHGFHKFWVNQAPQSSQLVRKLIPEQLLRTACFWMDNENGDFFANIPYVFTTSGRYDYIEPGDMIVTVDWGSDGMGFRELVTNYKWVADKVWLQQNYELVNPLPTQPSLSDAGEI